MSDTEGQVVSLRKKLGWLWMALGAVAVLSAAPLIARMRTEVADLGLKVVGG